MRIIRLFTVSYFFREIVDVNCWLRWAAILVSWCEQNWGEYKMTVGSGDGVYSFGWMGGKNRETVTALLSCVHGISCSSDSNTCMIGLRDNRVHQSADNLSDRKWHSSLNSSGQNGIDFRIIFWRMFWFWSSLCFLSWRIGFKAAAKEAVSHWGEDFPSCGTSSTPRCILKRSASPFSWNVDVLSSTDWNLNLIAAKTAPVWTCRFCRLF